MWHKVHLRTKQPQTTNDRQLEIGFQFAPVHQRYSSCCILAFHHPHGFLPSLRPLYELARRLFDSLPLFVYSLIASRIYTSHSPISSLPSTFTPVFLPFSKVCLFPSALFSPMCLSSMFRLCGLLSLAEFCKVISICSKIRPVLIPSA